MYRKILENNPSVLDGTILIVDDSDVSRAIMENIFSASGYKNIFFAENGREALEKVKKINPDLVISDIFMPEMDGYELIKKIRELEEFSYIPVIAQTGSNDPQELAKAFACGASDVTSKPIQKEELLARVTFHLENIIFRKRVEKELEAAKELQLTLLPPESEINSLEEKYGIEAASYLLPSSELSGDFWGFKKISHSELGVYTADITGHGIAAALNTFRSQSLLNDPNNFFSSTNLFLKKMNKRLMGLLPTGKFLTLFYGVININDNFIQYSSAAAPGGVVIKKNGKVENLKASGVPLGVSEDAEYDAFEIKFEKGDILVLYSDALLETTNDKDAFFSQDEINSALSENKDLPAKEILDKLIQKFKAHIGKKKITDDLTVNIYKRL